MRRRSWRRSMAKGQGYTTSLGWRVLANVPDSGHDDGPHGPEV